MWGLLKGFVEKKAGWDVSSAERVFRFLLYLSPVSAVVWTIIVVLSF
jgi:hypothetical protein